MILLDMKDGSAPLLSYLQSLTKDVLPTFTEYADVSWTGNGPDDHPVLVGVEYKKIDEIIGIICGDTRFAGHQVHGLVTRFDRRYLLIEGRFRIDRSNGHIQKLRGGEWQYIIKQGRYFTSAHLEHWITTIEEQAQFRVKVTFNPYESAQWLVDKHSWYVNKGWADHTALKQFYVPPPPTTMLIGKPKLVKRVAKEFYKVGWEKAIEVAARFKSVRDMCNANVEAWRGIPGIGETLSERIVKEITGEIDV